MGIFYTYQAFTNLFGFIEPELIKKEFLIPNSYACGEEKLIYPPSIYLIGKKQIKLFNHQNKKELQAEIELIFSKAGHLTSTITLEIDLGEYAEISSTLFSGGDKSLAFQKLPLLEISWRITEAIFGKPYLDFVFDYQLQTDYFFNYIKKFGIKLTDAGGSLSLMNLVSISDEESWQKVKEIELEKSEGGSIIKNNIIIPNFNNTALSHDPEIHILNSNYIILYTNDKIIKRTTNLIIGFKYQSFGLFFLKFHMLEIKESYQKLIAYYTNPNSAQISWIYIDKALAKLENKFDELVSMYELEFLETNDESFQNYQNLSFLDKLKEIIEYNKAERQYLLAKRNTRECLSSLREKVSDKGEKEQRKAYDRIVAVIGILTIFQVVLQILPLLQSETVVLIRWIFVLLFIPAIIIVWYITSYNNKKHIKVAERLEYKSNLIRQKQVVSDGLLFFKERSTQEVSEISDETLTYEINSLEERVKVIDNELKKLN